MAKHAKTIVGFDSAWADNPKAPGAVAVVRSTGIGWALREPVLASFDQAQKLILSEADEAELCLVAIDQPTIVPNARGCRPVDRVAASLISWIGGGVQPANRSKTGLFCDDAPIWRFKAQLGANEDPELARQSASGLFLIEVFPALALPSMNGRFCARRGAPRYNPKQRKTFRQEDWLAVVDTARHFGRLHGVRGLDRWCLRQRQLALPRKTNQDLIDALLAALIGLHWLCADRTHSIMIGDMAQGYMIAPASAEARARLEAAALRCGVAGR